MRLHLPPSLRAALLSCFAVVSGGFTVCSGTIAIGAVAASVIAASHASAQWTPPAINYTGTVAVPAAVTDPLGITENSLINYAYDGNVGPISAGAFNIKLAAQGTGSLMNLGNNTITAASVWFSQGRFAVAGASLANSTVYAQGGQFYLSGTLANTVRLYVGSSTYSGESLASLKNAALRLEGGAIVNGAVDLVEDAVIAIHQPGTEVMTGTLAGALTTGDFLLTKKGAGTLLAKNIAGKQIKRLDVQEGTFRFEVPTQADFVTLGQVALGANSTLSVHNVGGGAVSFQVIENLTVNGSATLRSQHNSGGWRIGNLQGTNQTLTMDFGEDSTIAHYSLIEGGAFSGTLSLKQTNGGANRNAMFGVSGTEVLANTRVEMNQISSPTGLICFAVGGAIGNTVKIMGLDGIAGSYLVSYDVSSTTRPNSLTANNRSALNEILALNENRTLELTGDGTYSFKGIVGSGLTIRKTGTGTQELGRFGSNTTFDVQAGTMILSGATQGTPTSIHIAKGATVRMPWLMEAIPSGSLFKAFYGRPDYVTGEGTFEIVNDIWGVGNTSDTGGGDPAYTILDVTGFTGSSVALRSGLVSLVDSSNFGSITKFILNGGGLIVPNSNNANTYTVSQDIEVLGNGYLRAWGGNGGDQSAKNIFTGAITGAGTLTKTDQGEITFAGDMSGFTGSVAIGQGSLLFDTDASLSSLAMRNDSRIKIVNGHQVSVTAAESKPVAVGSYRIVLEDGGNLSFNNILKISGNPANTSTLDISSSTYGSVSTKQFVGGDTISTVLNIGVNTAFNVTGSTGGSSGNFVNDNAFVINHWQSAVTYTVNGTLNMLNCPTFSAVTLTAEKPSTLTVNNGGVMNLMGLNLKWRDGIGTNAPFMVKLEQGSIMNLGSGGLATNDNIDLILNGGTIGILDSTLSWTSARVLTLNGDVSIDTRLYTAATDGKAGTYSDKGGTISLSGAITGTGTLIKKGEGTLLLSAVDKLDVQGGIVGLSQGDTLTIGSLAQMTESGGRFLVNLGTQKINAATYDGRVNLDVYFAGGLGEAPGYDVFQGAAGLLADNLDIRYFMDRGITANYTVTNGLVHVTLSGTSEIANITWAGTEGSVWANSDEEAWTGGGGNRFSTGDTVTFDGGGIKDVTIVGKVNPGAIIVSGTEDYTFKQGSLEGNGALTKSGEGKLTLLTTTALDWTGDVNLQGGTIAFADSLGKGNHINVSGTSTLEWLAGNTVDISSRLSVTEGIGLTFDVGGNGTVTFGTAVANTADYVKAGTGSLRLNAANTLSGTLTINQGDVIWGAGGATGSFAGSVTVNNGGRLVFVTGDATGYGAAQVSGITINKGGTLLINTTANQTLVGLNLTLQGGTLSGVDAARFDLGLGASTSSVNTLASDTTSTISANVSIRQSTGVTFNVEDGLADTDLLLTKNLGTSTGGGAFIKAGAGTMQVAGTYSAGVVTVNGGKLILGNGSQTGNINIAEGAELEIRGEFKWTHDDVTANNTGTITLASTGVMWSHTLWKHHETLGAGFTLKGSGKWIVGVPYSTGQTDGIRLLKINGNTADFTGIIELQGTGGTGNTYRTGIELNSADGILGGVVRMQGVTFVANGWSTNDNNVVPTQTRLQLMKSMDIGGIEGKGGELLTTVADGVDLTIGRETDHVFSGSMTGNFKTITKKGTGTQVFDGNLSASLPGVGTITVSGGRLGLGTASYAGNLVLSGAGSALAAGNVAVGTGKTLTVSALTTVIDSNLDIAGGSVILGQDIGNYSVGLNNHTLNISATSKTDLSLVLADNLAAGDTIDLFTGIAGLTDENGALTLGADTLLTDYFTTSLLGLTGAKLQLSGDKLQILLTRSTGSYIYGQGNNGVWQEGQAFEANDNPFAAGKNVLFGNLGSDETMAVQLKGNLSVGAMSVDAGAGNTYVFNQHADTGAIVDLQGMEVRSGTAELGTGVLAPAADTAIVVKNTGTLLLNTGSTNEHVALTMEDGSALKWGTGNTTDYSTQGGITVTNNANVTLDLNGNAVSLNTAVANSGNYAVKGGNLTLGSHEILTGSVSLSDGGNLILLENAATAGAYALNISGTGGVSIGVSLDGTTPVSLSGTNTYSGNTTLLAGAHLQVTSASLSGNTSGIILTGNTGKETTFEYTANQNATLAQNFSGTGKLIFNGAYEITLSGTNGNSGSIEIGTGTTLKTTNTSIGSAGNTITNKGTLELDSGTSSYTVAQSISGAGSIKLKGTNLTWDASNKTYTGNTTIQTGSTVSSTGALTSGALGNTEVRLVTVDSSAKLILTDAAATESWLDNGGGNNKGLFLRGDGTVRLAFSAPGEVTSEGFIARALQNTGSLGTMELASGVRLNLSTDRSAKLATVGTLKVESGANVTFANGTTAWGGTLLSIAGNGIAGEAAGSEKASALAMNAGIVVSRSLSLADNATAYVAAGGSYSTLSGAYVSNGRTLTKTGAGGLVMGAGTLGTGSDTTGMIDVAAGVLSFNLGSANISGGGTPYIWQGRISLADGTKLNKHDGYTSLTGGLAVTGNVAISSNYAKGLALGAVSGSGVITLERGTNDTGTAEQLVLGAENTFSGTWNVTGLWSLNANDARALSTAKVNLGTSASLLKLGVASADLIELEGGSASGLTLDSSLASGVLTITGTGTKTFSGSVAGNLTVEMNGSGTQTLNGALADNSAFKATQGVLAIASTNQTGSHVFTANGGEMNMTGYTRASSATGADSFVFNSGSFKNLTLGANMEIKAGDGVTGNVVLTGTTVLDGGTMTFRLTDNESPAGSGYYDLANSYSIDAGGSISMGSGTTMLSFVPVDKNLYPNQGSLGMDYILIYGIGSGISASDLSKFTLNMSSEGRTQYTLKLDNGKLVLNVKGAAGTLVWQGAAGNLWNTDENNLAWLSATNPERFYDDDMVSFGTLAGSSGETVNIDPSGVKMGGMTVTGSTDYTFEGGAISSSQGNTNAGLTIGKNDTAFTGTLTINTANTYAGNTVVNSGTVIAGDKAAFSNTKLTINNGVVSLAFDDTLATKSVDMKGGVLDATGNVTVNKVSLIGTAAEHTLTASQGKNLTVKSAVNAVEGALTIGSSTDADKTGSVTLDAEALALTHAQDIAVESGELILKGSTGSYTGANIVLNGGDLTIMGGLTATLKTLTGTGGTATVDNSTLAFSQSTTLSMALSSKAGTISGISGLTLNDLQLAEGKTSLVGSISLEDISFAENTTLAVGNAATAGSLVLGADVTELDNVDVVNGSLTVKDGDSIGLLTSAGSVTTLASDADLTVETANLKAGSSISDSIALTLTGADSWLGEDNAVGGATTVGTVTVDGAGASVHLGGQLRADAITVKQGTLFINQASAVVSDGITLDGSNALLDMTSKASAIAVEMNQGALSNAGAYTGVITIDDTSTGGRNFAMGGLTSNSTVKIDKLATGSSLTNLQNLKLGDSTITLSSGMSRIFVMNAPTGIVSLADGSTLKVIASSVINQVISAGSASFGLTNGSLSGLLDGAAYKGDVIFDPTLGLYNISSSANGGNMVLTAHSSVDPSTIYKSTEDGVSINTYNAMDAFSMVDINASTQIDLTNAAMNQNQESEGLIIKNLHNTSAEQTTLAITGTDEDLVSLNNNLSSTWFNGNINVDGAKLQVNNTNASPDSTENPKDRELVILGTMRSNALVSLNNGKLVLNGNGNELSGGLNFFEGATSKGLLAVNGNTAIGGAINGAQGSSADILVNNAALTLKHGSEVNAWLSGNGGNEVITIENGGTATFGSNARVDRIGLIVAEESTADIQTTGQGVLAFNGLAGTGTLTGQNDADMTLDLEGKSASFSGDMENYNGTIRIKGTGSQTLESSMNTGSRLVLEGGNLILKTSPVIDPVATNPSYGNILSTAGSKLTLQTTASTDQGLAGNNHIDIFDLSMSQDTLAFNLNLTNDLKSQSGAVATVGSGNALLSNTTVELNINSIASDFSFRPGESMTLFLLSGVSSDSTVTLGSGASALLLSKYYSSSEVKVADGFLYLTGTTVSGDTARFHSDAALSETGRAGAALLDYLYATKNPQINSPDTIESKVLSALEEVILAGNRGEADRIMSGVAGSTVTSLGAAFSSSLNNQIDAIRTRMSGMGLDQSVVNEDLPGFHAWINANGGRGDLSNDGTFSGYTLDTWGGSVGLGLDLSERLTIGAAFNASYGNLKASAAEYAKGDLDTYTATVFARVQNKRWTHDFAVAGATADAKLSRTVDYGEGSYSTHGTTSGFGVAALYEVGYAIQLEQDKPDIIQPLFRASLTHSSMDSYSETGAQGMGLDVGKQDITYATFGVGARYFATVGQNLYNRDSILELRALILQDAGSRRGEADVALNGSPGRSRRVKGSEPGSTGIQIGAGLTIPVEVSSSIFMDVNFDARSKMTTVGGAVGYRIDF